MSSDFIVTSIGSACEISTGFPFKSNDYCAKSESIKLLRGDNIAQGSLRWDGVKRWNPEALERSVEAKYLLRSGDVVVAMDRPWIEAGLKFAAIQESDLPCLLVQRVACLRAGESIDQGFLKYVVSGYAFTSHVLAVQTGTAVPHISSKQIAEYEFAAPPLVEQKAIAHILGTLDDKIELNRKTNETLEAMAKALFKSWFVNFDPVRAKTEGRSTGMPAEISDLFPDSFEDSELGEIPSGWQCCSFTQLVDVISGGTPKTSVDEYWNGSVNWFSVVDAPSSSDCWVIQTEKSITHQGLDNCSSKLLSTGTTIISARGTVGKVCLAGQDMAMNQSCYGLRSKAANGEYFCFYLTKSLVEILEARAHGSVFSTITRDTLDGVSTISPPLEVIQSFNGIAGALLGKIKNNLEDNRILGNQRDALLPKLISGEIRIPDAERMLEEVGV
jgi:type I restriction enzyme S subunit